MERQHAIFRNCEGFTAPLTAIVQQAELSTRLYGVNASKTVHLCFGLSKSNTNVGGKCLQYFADVAFYTSLMVSQDR